VATDPTTAPIAGRRRLDLAAARRGTWIVGPIGRVSTTFAHVAFFRTELDQTPPRRDKRHLFGRVRRAFEASAVSSHPSTPRIGQGIGQLTGVSQLIELDSCKAEAGNGVAVSL
jgi:hypothetical protein